MAGDEQSPLGRQTEYPSRYDPELLYPIPRWAARSLLDVDKKVRFYGFDHWRAYELSWLDGNSRPCIAALEIFFNSESENLIESKSLKLYLNSFNGEVIESEEKLLETLQTDLSAVSRSEVKLVLKKHSDLQADGLGRLAGEDIDDLRIEAPPAEPDASLLGFLDEPVFDETLCSHLFRSNCPVTGQPDWASVQIQYSGSRIERGGLLRYLLSFRNHQGYHEECAERIFRDLMLRCQPAELTIAMNYLRRGGIEINVYRSTRLLQSNEINPRLARQ